MSNFKKSTTTDGSPHASLDFFLRRSHPAATVLNDLVGDVIQQARDQLLGEIESAADAWFQEVHSNIWRATHFP